MTNTFKFWLCLFLAAVNIAAAQLAPEKEIGEFHFVAAAICVVAAVLCWITQDEPKEEDGDDR